jgi:hypothetical protein
MCGGVNHSWFRRHCEPTGRANARPMTGSAKQSGASRLALDCFVALLLAMTSVRILAARFASEFCTNFVPRKQRAQGRPGAGRTRSLVCSKKAHELVTTGSTETSGLPCAMVLTLLRALPGVRDLIVTVACETSSRKLSASPGAPGPHDLAVRSRDCPSGNSVASTAFRSNARDGRDAPLSPNRNSRIRSTTFCKTEEKFSPQTHRIIGRD